MFTKKVFFKMLFFVGFFVSTGTVFSVEINDLMSYEEQMIYIQNKLAFILGSINLDDTISIGQALFDLDNVIVVIDNQTVVTSSAREKVENAIATIQYALDRMRKIGDSKARKHEARIQLKNLNSALKSLKIGFFESSKTSIDLKNAVSIGIESFISTIENWV